MILLSFLLWFGSGEDSADVRPSQLVHTYSIVAYDPNSGEIGAAVQSHWFSVGGLVIWAKAGVGAVATQSFVKVDYGPLGLRALGSGASPGDALAKLLAEDAGEAVRQVAMVDARGRVAAHTGAKCIREACDLQGKNFSVQANLMLKDGVCEAMAEAYEAAQGKPMADRLLAALSAAQAEGGDLRGQQSAAMKVVSSEKPEREWRGVVLDLRVEDHPRPLEELGRLIAVSKAYDSMNRGDLALEHKKIEEAMNHYRQAVSQLPGRVEPLFWQAVNLVSIDRLSEALPLFKKVFQADANWRVLPPRLVEVGLLPDQPEVLAEIAGQ